MKQGYGTTNVKITPTRFFRNNDMSSKITRLDKELIFRFQALFEAIITRDIDEQKFADYAIESAEL